MLDMVLAMLIIAVLVWVSGCTRLTNEASWKAECRCADCSFKCERVETQEHIEVKK